MAATDHADGVTVVVVRTVKAGREAEYETWLHGVAQAATKFPGHLGITVFRPRKGSRDYTLVFKFDTDDHLDAWTKSPERADWVARCEPFTERVTIHKLTGLETWFANPDSPVVVPPRWKMAIVSWCVAFPIIQLMSMTLGRALADFPDLARGAIFGIVMVALMTYVAMPQVTKLLRGWLYPKPD